jgi:putative transposase
MSCAPSGYRGASKREPALGYQRIAGELKQLGLAVSATTVRKVLAAADVPPAPERGQQSWRSFLHQQAASTLACDFFTVETLTLQRIYVLFFISLATRRLEFAACTANPDGAWVTQQARNLVMQLGERQPQFRLLVHDRDTKFSRAFDEVFRTEGIDVICTPVRAPNANAFAERWVRTVRNDCLDRILILGRRHLDRVLNVYTKHYNEHRPHRALQLAPPYGSNSADDRNTATATNVSRHDLLGGLIHQYRQAA